MNDGLSYSDGDPVQEGEHTMRTDGIADGGTTGSTETQAFSAQEGAFGAWNSDANASERHSDAKKHALGWIIACAAATVTAVVLLVLFLGVLQRENTAHAEIEKAVQEISDSQAAVNAEGYYIAVAANDDDGGKVSGGGVYALGENIAISAAAAEGYRFSGWSDGEKKANRQQTAEGDAAYIALFVKTTPIPTSVATEAPVAVPSPTPKTTPRNPKTPKPSTPAAASVAQPTPTPKASPLNSETPQPSAPAATQSIDSLTVDYLRGSWNYDTFMLAFYNNTVEMSNRSQVDNGQQMFTGSGSYSITGKWTLTIKATLHYTDYDNISNVIGTHDKTVSWKCSVEALSPTKAIFKISGLGTYSMKRA